jgi:hypothetical protein
MKARPLLAVALAATLAPAVSSAAPRTTGSQAPSMQNLSVGGFIGYETDDLSGLALRLDGEMPFTALSEQATLSLVGSVGYSYLTEDFEGTTYDFTAHVLKVIPAARISFAINPQFTLFGDAGLGVYYAAVNIDTPDPIFNDAVEDEFGGFGIMMRIGGGAWYHLSPTMRIGAGIEFDPYFGDFDQTTFIAQVGAMFRL